MYWTQTEYADGGDCTCNAAKDPCDEWYAGKLDQSSCGGDTDGDGDGDGGEGDDGAIITQLSAVALALVATLAF